MALTSLDLIQASHDRRVASLLEANNRYLQEARDARAELRIERVKVAALSHLLGLASL